MRNIISLRNYREFKNVYDEKKSYADKNLIMYVKENGLAKKRLGISVSKKVGNSVVRHRLARLIRESYRLNNEYFRTGVDVIFIARPAANGKGYRDIEKSMLFLLKLHGFMDQN